MSPVARRRRPPPPPPSSPLPSAASSSVTTGRPAALPANPYECPVDAVLEPNLAGTTGAPPSTLRELVHLLLDPSAAGVEEVGLGAFAAMVPKRQLAAVGGCKEWLEVLLGSEHYQASKDARALRLAGIVSLGQWEAHRDRVAISAYSRGLLEQAYYTITRSPKQQQGNEVLEWLSKTIHRAIVEELMPSLSGEASSKGLSGSQQQLVMPLLTAAASITGAGEGKGAGTGSVTPPVEGAAVEESINNTSGNSVEVSKPVENIEQGPKLHKKHSPTVGKGLSEPHDVTEESAPLAPRRGKKRHARASYNKMKELTVENTPQGKEDHRPPVEVGEEEGATDNVSKKSRAAASASALADPPTAAGDQDDIDVQEEEEYEEVEEEIEEEVSDQDLKVAYEGEEGRDTPAAASSAGEPSADPKAEMKLARLAELMLSQFNSADGYLHLPEKEIRTDEKNGYVVVIDEDTAQVDPLGLFSSYHAVEVSEESPIEVRALKQTWSAFNYHQIAMEEAKDEATMNFHRQKGVDVLVHGALLMRAISRGGEIDLNYASSLPSYGFPLLSSDPRPFGAKRPRSSPHTDMTFMSVDAAGLAFKKYFAKKEVRATPFRPKVDFNAGCGVAQLVGSALHLYETSLKESVQEGEVRPRFAEAMLGVLNLVRSKVLPRLSLVEYHVIVTSLPATAAGEEYVDNNEIMSPTTIVSIDLTGPFTSAERARLEALGEPLGFNAEQIHEFTCVEDIISELEHAGVSVVHDLLQNRDDLESLLTPTLVELLPDENASDNNEAAAEAEDEEPAPEEEEEEVEEEEEAEEEEEEEEDATPTAPPAVAAGKKEHAFTTSSGNHHNANNRQRKGSGPVAAAPPSAAHEPIDELTQEEDELYRRMLEEELEETPEGRGAAGKKEPTPAPRAGPVQVKGPASVTAAEEEEEEEVVRAPVLPKAAPGRKAVPILATASARRLGRAPVRTGVSKVDEVGEKSAPSTAPRSELALPKRSIGGGLGAQPLEGAVTQDGFPHRPPPRSGGPLKEEGREGSYHGSNSAVNPPIEKVAHAKDAHAARPVPIENQEQWFKKKPKRRHFP